MLSPILKRKLRFFIINVLGENIALVFFGMVSIVIHGYQRMHQETLSCGKEAQAKI